MVVGSQGGKGGESGVKKATLTRNVEGCALRMQLPNAAVAQATSGWCGANHLLTTALHSHKQQLPMSNTPPPPLQHSRVGADQAAQLLLQSCQQPPCGVKEALRLVHLQGAALVVVQLSQRGSISYLLKADRGRRATRQQVGSASALLEREPPALLLCVESNHGLVVALLLGVALHLL